MMVCLPRENSIKRGHSYPSLHYKPSHAAITFHAMQSFGRISPSSISNGAIESRRPSVHSSSSPCLSRASPEACTLHVSDVLNQSMASVGLQACGCFSCVFDPFLLLASYRRTRAGCTAWPFLILPSYRLQKGVAARKRGRECRKKRRGKTIAKSKSTNNTASTKGNRVRELGDAGCCLKI
jgi:hypothetical protein